MNDKLIDIAALGPIKNSTPKENNDYWTMSAEDFNIFLDNNRKRLTRTESINN